MVPTMKTEIIKIQQRELSRRAEATRRRREAQEWLQDAPRSYTQAMRVVDEANVAARRGLVAEARRLFRLAYDLPARQSAQTP